VEELCRHEGEGGEERDERQDGDEGERGGALGDAVGGDLLAQQPQEGEGALQPAAPAFRRPRAVGRLVAGPLAEARPRGGRHAGGF
jgi:hypothetical protein